jgi:predicted MFS family arabinose efflux permease
VARAPPLLPTTLIFVGFMVANAFRQVPINTLTTRVPRPEERARFLSLQSAVQHVGSASGAILSARMLRERPDHALVGMPEVALVAIALTAALPWLLRAVDAGVRADEHARSAAKSGARDP